ncbi:MAG: hypothetical protein AABX38_07425 [Candidatus Micrarchaeota archaeon]
MKRTIIPLLLVLLISFGCTSSDTTKIIKNESNTSSNLTNITIQKIQIPINETPKIVEGNGTNGTAKDALKLAKETILPYSDNFILWLKGENINEQGIPKREGFWSVILVTPDVQASNETAISVSSGIIYSKRSDFRIGIDPIKAKITELPKIYTLENEYIDSPRIVNKTKGYITNYYNNTNMTNVILDNFNILYYNSQIKVISTEQQTGTMFVVCMDYAGSLIQVRTEAINDICNFKRIDDI